MASLEETAKHYNAWEKSDKNEFQRRARLLQSIWRESKGYSMGKKNRSSLQNSSDHLPRDASFTGKVSNELMGSRLAEEDADELNNFLTGSIREAVELALSERNAGQLIQKSRLFTNLLSSQPLCFNLFGDLVTRCKKAKDYSSATKIFAELMQKPLRSVTHLEFEKSPGRGKAAFLGDRTAFDFYVEYELTSGEKGFLGIEVKYHENLAGSEWIDAMGRHTKRVNLSDSGSVAAEKPKYRPNKRYIEVADQSGCFKKESYPELGQSPLVQIWRDHLLAASMLQPKGEQYLRQEYKVKFHEGCYAFLYPAQNSDCRNAAESYRSHLTRQDTFFTRTLEEVITVFRKFVHEPWLEEFVKRYLDFAPVDALLD